MSSYYNEAHHPSCQGDGSIGRHESFSDFSTNHRPRTDTRCGAAIFLLTDRRRELRPAITDYTRHLRAQGHSAATIRVYSYVLRLFAETAPRRLGAITSDHIEAHLDGRWSAGNKPASVALHLKALRAFFAWAVAKGRLKRSPAASVPLPHWRPDAIEPYTPAQVAAMFASAHTAQERAVVAVLLNTGIRASELCRLRPEDVKAGRLLIQGKGAKQRWVGVDTGTEELLRAQMAESDSDTVFGLVDRHAAMYVVRRLARRAGVPKAHPHRFRNTFAVMYLKSGGDALDLQTLLGHSSLEQTKRYVEWGKADRAIEGQLKHAPSVSPEPSFGHTGHDPSP